MDDRNIPVTLDLVGKNAPDQSISDALQELGRLRGILTEHQGVTFLDADARPTGEHGARYVLLSREAYRELATDRLRGLSERLDVPMKLPPDDSNLNRKARREAARRRRSGR